MYLLMTPRSCLNIKWMLFLALLINDIFTVIANVTYFVTPGSDSLFRYAREGGYYGYIPPPFADSAIIVSYILSDWCAMTHFIPALFCCLCFVLKKILQGFKLKLLKMDRRSSDRFYHTYSEILRVISTTNKYFSEMLVITFTVLLVRVFHNTYVLLLSDPTKKAFRVTTILLCFVRFAIICISSASVKNAVSEIKHMALDILVDGRKCENIRLVLKIKEDFDGFKLLDSLIIDRNLIFSAVGSLLTYGILIANIS